MKNLLKTITLTIGLVTATLPHMLIRSLHIQISWVDMITMVILVAHLIQILWEDMTIISLIITLMDYGIINKKLILQLKKKAAFAAFFLYKNYHEISSCFIYIFLFI